MKKLFFLVFISWLFTLNVQAKDYKLFGKILFTDSKSPKEVSVVAMTADSLIKNHQLTHADGTFMWKNLPVSRYIFKVDIAGYERVNLLVDWKNDRHIDLGTISILPKKKSSLDVDLPEVVVTGSSIIQKVDKMIVFPKAAQLKISSGSIDLLQTLNLPGMTVNPIEQKVLIEGAAPIYQINGRPQPREQVLGLSPDDIDRIEYSSSPSIRYANSNAGGVINFILKEKQNGGNLFSNLMASPMTGFLNGTLSTSLRHKKSEFTLLYNNSWRDYDKRWTDRGESFVSPYSTIDRLSAGRYSPFGYLSQEINLGYNLQINDRTMFSATFLNSIGRQHTSINSDILQTENQGANTKINRESKALFKAYSPSIDLFLIHRFRNNHSLEFNVVGTLTQSDYTRHLTDSYATSSVVEKFNNNVDNSRQSLIAEATYRFKVGTQQLGFGLRHLQSYTRNDYSGNSDQTTRMNSGDTYMHGEWKGSLNKFSYSLGVGIKYYQVSNHLDQRTYFRNLVSLNLLYPLSKNFRLSYLFQLKPSLPTLSQLSDVEQSYEKILVIKGNPQLKAYNTVRNRLLMTYNKSNLNVNLWLSHTKTFHPISIYTYYEPQTFVSEYRNQNYNQQTNAQLDINLSKLFKCLNFSTSVGWNRFSTSGEDYRHQLYNLYWSASVQAYYKSWYLVGSYTRPKKELSGEIVSLEENNSTLMLGYRHGRLSLRAGVYYPFTKAWKVKSESLSSVNPFSESVRIKDNGNMFVLGVSYQLNWGKSLKKSKKSLQNADGEVGILKVQE